MTQLILKEFDFMGDVVVAVEYNNVWYFSPKHFCETIGLSWGSQYRKLKNQLKKFNCTHMSTVGQDGRIREMVGIPVTHINTWVLNINANKVKDKTKKETLEHYQARLSGWLYEVGFLGAAVNEAVELEKIDEVLNEAKDRVVFKQETLEDYKGKVDLVMGLPRDLPTIEQYQANRVRMLTDLKLGVSHPLFDPNVRGVARLTEEDFYNAFMIERWCLDKLVCYFPKDLPTPEAVLSYIAQKGYPEPHDVGSIHPTKARHMIKSYTLYGQTMTEMILYHNKPADMVYEAMQKELDILKQVFESTKIELDFPQIRDSRSMSARRAEYMKKAEWWDKRNAFFKVFNCCWMCGDFVVASSNYCAHHLHYDTLGFEDPWDLAPMCKPCHARHEGKVK